MTSQRRVLFLADVPAHERFERFEKECYLRQLKPTTAEGLWSTWLSVQKIVCPDDALNDWTARVSKILKARCIRCPIDFPTPATDEHILQLFSTYVTVHPDLSIVMTFAYVMGQRISDMLQLGSHDIYTKTFNGQDYLVVIIRRGKTIGMRNPYTLFIPMEIWPAADLLYLAQRATKMDRLFLLSKQNHPRDLEKMSGLCRDMLSSISTDLELRSLRRGGLQRMANDGAPLDAILQFSHHATPEMLMRYLGWGANLASKATTMEAVLKRNNLRPPIPVLASTQTTRKL
jgi:hypothetical protein